MAAVAIAPGREKWYNSVMLEKPGDGWRDLRWFLPLDVPPEVAQVGFGVHGQDGWERYLLRDLWCLHLYTYETTVTVGTHRLPIRPGHAGLIPPNTPVLYEFTGHSRHLFVHFRCPLGGPGVAIPAMQDLDSDFPRVFRDLEEIVLGATLPAHRVRARVWDILGRLAAREVGVGPADLPTAHPAVARAARLVELRLAEPFALTEIAREVGVTEDYLGRLFREAFGTTLTAYVRRRRVRRAEHLLRHSTLPIKAVAAASGLPDLHFFNKTIRRELGKSPRALRADG